ncbi:prolyl 3-hydroxylase OGFOD1 [Bemisia tabaci]|uniref:prolyl 3-hydroxylase OGFOD1 n=1 Tax=Bemisia tabaci TaxID=7038 RepID=UPI0008F9924B|nr:PREDICTED: prolyl 3-hydroxylase OGFOD1 [Bemisia tabaci]
MRLNDDLLLEFPKISKALKNKTPLESKYAEVITSPFEVIRFENFIKGKASIRKLIKNLDRLEFDENDNDLHCSKATTDLHNIHSPIIKKLISLIEKDVAKLLSKLYKIKLKPTISITASKYLDGDYLLCHDDKCEDRAIAFIWYLSEKWRPLWGGSLDLFNQDDDGQPNSIVRKIFPEFNSFVCFQVGNYTYHQVSEVVSKDAVRLTINGWFHAKRPPLDPVAYIDTIPPLRLPKNLPANVYLSSFINSLYLTESTIEGLTLIFEENRNVMLPDALLERVFKNALLDLFQYSVKWRKKGPPNRRNYDCADEGSLELTLQSLLTVVTSKPMLTLLESITNMKLNKMLKNGGGITIEVQKWKSGYYSLLYDENQSSETEGLDMYLFFNVEGVYQGLFETGGTVLYSPATEDEEGTVIDPVDNALCLVAKRKGETKYVKYCNHKMKNSFFVIQISFLSCF